MSQSDITYVRIYLIEGRDPVGKVIKALESIQPHGFTMFRGVAGMGRDHKLHKASLLDLSSELPVVIEFFDEPQRITEIIQTLEPLIKTDHIISWSAKVGF